MGTNFSHWIKKVQDTLDEEIDCSACLDQISEYVDLELATGEAAQRMSHINHHVSQCAVCREEYEILLELARSEALDDLPAQEELVKRLKRRE